MNLRSPERTARRIALYLYVPVASAWILGTDLLVAVTTASWGQAVVVNMLKGAAFAVVTGLLLYVLIRRELEAREARDRDLRTLAEHVPDLVFRLQVRPELRFEYVTPSSVDIGGYAPEEYYGDAEAMLKTVHPEDQPRLHALLTDMDSETEEAELRWRHKDGQVVWSEIRVRKERGLDGRVERLSGVLRDVTTHREAERLRALLASALEAASESVLITDRQGVIQYVNRAFTEITGYLPEDVLGKTPRILRSGQQDDSFYAQLWSTITSGRTFRGVLVNRRADGELYEQATSITPIRGDGGAVEHFVAVGRDITVQRALERRLRFTEKMDAVGQLAAGVAHDFRNLLNVILVNSELVRSELPADAPVRGEVDEVLKAAKRGADLVGRLLRVARQPEVERRRTDIGTLLSEMRGMLDAMLLDSVALEIEIRDGPWVVDADPDLVQDALLNLVANAGQAMPHGGAVTVCVGPGGVASEVRVEVRDTGVGMDDATLARIFDPFFTTKEHGTGLGLPMVKGIVERHGGALEVVSTPGGGTTVSVRLPRASDEDQADGLDGTESSREAEGTRDAGDPGGRILLVEDDGRLRKAAERVLVRFGYQVTTAEDGLHALEHLSADPGGWTLVISDLVMPRMGGLELYEALQERGWDVPFLFMSGHPPEAVSTPGGGAASWAFLEKPWTVDTLRTRVREAVSAERRSA